MLGLLHAAAAAFLVEPLCERGLSGFHTSRLQCPYFGDRAS